MIDWRGMRELLRSDWVFWWFFVPVTVAPFALLLWGWFGGLQWPSTEEMLKFIDKFQTLIAAIAGFGGLISVTLWGFKHSIESSEREAETAREMADETRNQDMQALAAALSAEFDVISNSIAILQAQIEWQQAKNEASPVALWKPSTEIFRNNTDRLGLFGARMARHVTNVTALASILSESVATSWSQLSNDQERAEGIIKKTDDVAREAYVISFQLELISEGMEPDEALSRFTPEVIAEILPPAPTYTPPHPDAPEDGDERKGNSG